MSQVSAFSPLDLTAFKTASMGALIDALKALPSELGAYYDWCDLTPCGVASYRGYYDHMALGYEVDGVGSLPHIVKELEAAIGNTFEGYKGGTFRMTRETPVWCANWGNTGRRIIGLRVTTWSATIITEEDTWDD